MDKLKYHYIQDYPTPAPYGDIALRQIGIAYCGPSSIVDTHPHDNYFELSIVTSGQGTIYTNGVPTAVVEGDIYVSFPYEEHRIDASKDAPLKYDFFAFVVENETFKQALYAFPNVQNNPDNRIIHNNTIKNLIKSILSELPTNYAYSKAYLETLFTQILIQLIRSLKNQNTNYSVYPSKSEELCYQIMHYIDTHIPMDSLNDLANIFNYDYNYLSNIFTKTTKQTLSSYYRLKRLDISRELIKEGNLSLTEISNRLHYSSLFAFSKSFKKQYGISPNKYKQKTTNKDDNV